MKKKLCSLLMLLLLLSSLFPAALAAKDYGLAYDATDQMDMAFMKSMSEDVFQQITNLSGVEVRLDIVRNLEDETIQDYAGIFYQNYEYGAGENHRGVLLMLYLLEDETGLAYGDHYILVGGGAEDVVTIEVQDALYGALSNYFNEGAWSGDLAQDLQACENGITAYAQILSDTLTQGAVQASVASGTQTIGAIETDGLDIGGSEEELILYAQDGAESRGDQNYVLDLMEVLTESEREELNQRAASVSQRYNSGVYIVTVPDYLDYSTVSPYEAAKAIYQDYDLGLGSDRSGALLMLSMADRDYAYIAHGDFANGAFTNYGKEQLEREFLDDFRNDDWYGGFSDFITESDRYMELAAAGTPVDVGQRAPRDPSVAGAVGLGAALSAAISGISCRGMKSKMKSVKQKTEAMAYVAGGRDWQSGLNLWATSDQFINTTVSRVSRHSDRSGGGGTTIDSGGFSGHSGKF